MLRTRILIVAATACLLFSAASEAQAQRTNRSVSRPPLNPFSSYLQGGYGMGFYDPLLSPLLRRIEIRSHGDKRAVRPHRPWVARPPAYRVSKWNALRARNRTQGAGVGGAPVGIAPTGTGSVYMNYSHFYSVGAGRRR